MSLSVGARVGTYEIVALVGAGGMGEVYRARDTRLDRDVAIKVLPRAFAADPERLARFEREAKVLASLSHPNIAQVHGLEDAGGGHALVMELVDGEDLSLRLARGPIPIAEALAIARQIADALDAAHDKGIVHRDLKPANVMLAPDGVAKVLDFGLARPGVSETRQSIAALTHSPTAIDTLGTREGVLLGTAAYMSPEQARGRVVDKRTDIWAFGCVLFEMLAGRPAFGRDNVSDTIAAIIEREAEWPALPATTPPTVRRVIERCLQKDPKRRLRDIGDARADLDDTHAAAPGPPTHARSRSLPAQVGVGAVLVAIGFAGGRLALREPTPEVRPIRLSVVAPRGTTFTQRDITEHPQFALSPEGDRLAFVAAARGERQRIWIRSLESGVAQPLTGTDGASGPFWAPDGRSIAFQAEGRLKAMSLDGTAPRNLVEMAFDVSNGAWNRDGVILFPSGSASSLFSVRATGGTATETTSLDPGRRETAHRWPQFLPDGRFIYFAGSATPEHSGVYLGSLGSRSSTKLLALPSNAVFAEPGYLFFEQNGVVTRQHFDSRSGTLVGMPESLGDPIHALRGPAYLPLSAARNGTIAFWQAPLTPSSLEWVDRTGRQLSTIAASSRYDSPSLSPDGTRVLATVRGTANDNEMWLFDAVSGSFSSRVTFTRGVARFGIWSPDSKDVVFSMGTEDGPQIFQRPASGAGGDVRIGDTGRHWAVFPDDWSRDGRRLIYLVTSQGGFDVWSLDIAQQKTEPLLQSPAVEVQPRLSPNGQWLAYASDESGSWEVYVMGLGDTPGKWQISRGGGMQPVWRGDGRELFYVNLDGVMTAVSIAGDRTMEPGTPRPMFQTTLPNVLAPFRTAYAVSADGQRFLLNSLRPNPEPSTITVVLNAVPGAAR